MANDWTPQRQRTVFAELYTAARSVFPSWGGKHVDDFYEVVTVTAKAQSEEPEALFRRHLATWLKRMPSEAKRAPYAFFRQAWGELADKGPETVQEAPRRRVDPAERLAELRAAFSLQEGRLAACRAAGKNDAPIVALMDEMRAEMRRLKAG